MHCNQQSNCLGAEKREDFRALRDFGAKVCPPCHVHHTGFSAPGTIWSRLDEQVSTLDQEALVMVDCIGINHCTLGNLEIKNLAK